MSDGESDHFAMHCFIALQFDNNCIELHCNVVLRCRRNISAVHYILTAIALNCIKKLQCHPVLHRRRQITKRREVKGNVSVCLFESNIFCVGKTILFGPHVHLGDPRDWGPATDPSCIKFHNIASKCISCMLKCFIAGEI